MYQLQTASNPGDWATPLNYHRIFLWMLDIFKKDRTAYVQYILADFPPRNVLVNVFAKPAASDMTDRAKIPVTGIKRRDHYEDKKICDISDNCSLPDGVNTSHPGGF
jgi:hypothetical protein